MTPWSPWPGPTASPGCAWRSSSHTSSKTPGGWWPGCGRGASPAATEVLAAPAGRGLGGQALHAPGRLFDVGPGEAAMAAEGHDAGDPTLVGPAVDGLRRHVQQAGHFSRRQELLGVRSGQGLGLLGLANVDIIDKTARFHNDLGLPTGNLSDF